MMALTIAFVGETVPKDGTGSAMGLLGTMSAIGTALGPSLGGVLIAALGWRAIFLVHVPLGILALLLAHRYLPVDRRGLKTDRAGFHPVGTLLLVLTLGAYALAMTLGHGHFGSLNLALLLAAVFGGTLFVFAEARAAAPLLRLVMFRDPVPSASLAMSALVSTVTMATSLSASRLSSAPRRLGHKEQERRDRSGKPRGVVLIETRSSQDVLFHLLSKSAGRFADLARLAARDEARRFPD